MNLMILKEDKTLQSGLQKMKDSIRENSRFRIKDAIELKDSFLSTLSKDAIKSLILDLETQIFEKNSQVDHQYKKKINDVCENIKFLKDYRDVAEMIIIKKTLPVTKLLLPHPVFKDSAQKIDKNLQEKRKQFREQQLKNKKQFEESKNSQDSSGRQGDVQIPNNQSLYGISYQSHGKEGNQMSDLDPELNRIQGQVLVKTIRDDSDDLESIDSNPALFSDDEDPAPVDLRQGSAQYDPFFQANAIMTSYNEQPQYQQPLKAMPVRRQLYNIYDVVEQIKRSGQRRITEPILYDPLKSKGASRERNSAPAGSLLKVWDGHIEMSKDFFVQTSFFSHCDIQLFQSLPEMPTTLTLKGKAKIQDVVSHFLKLKREKRLIRGWATRKSVTQQENNDKYTKMHEELESQQKAALFQVFQGVTFYILPINSQTRDFCNQMGIHPQFVNSKSTGIDADSSAIELETALVQETHQFALLSQIKQSFSSKINYLNPDVVLRVESPLQKSNKDDKIDQSFSPITSDEEGQALKKQSKMPIVKQEDTVMRSDHQSMVKQQNSGADDDDIDIDELIIGFKNKKYDIISIQNKLLKIIHKVTGEKEQKLTQFLQEVIQSYNGNQDMQDQPGNFVKQEAYNTQTLSQGYVSQVGIQGASYPSDIQYRPMPQHYMGQRMPQPPSGYMQQHQMPYQQQMYMGGSQQPIRSMGNPGMPNQQHQNQMHPNQRQQHMMGGPYHSGQPQYGGIRPQFQYNQGPGEIPQIRPPPTGQNLMPGQQQGPNPYYQQQQQQQQQQQYHGGYNQNNQSQGRR